jgi:hypothetical protein
VRALLLRSTIYDEVSNRFDSGCDGRLNKMLLVR